MTTTIRQLILRANALYIGVAGFAGMIFDIRGVLYGLGPQGRALANAPYAGIGFVEAHGLAVILAIVLWRAWPDRSAHLTALAVVALLGTANLAFWQVFIAMDALTMGYVTTALHWTFAALNLGAALAVHRGAEAEASALRWRVERTL
jgi:hypothetical protein